MGPIRIQRSRTKGWALSPGTVYVGRPSKWGNPYKIVNFRVMAKKGTPEQEAEYLQQMLKLYRRYITEVRPDLAAAAKVELAGRNLVCWCPLYDENGGRIPCHADILLQIANGWSDDEARRLLSFRREEMQ